VDVWSWLWIGWLAYFGIVEGVAIARSVRAKRAGHPDERDTLSEHVWLWFGTAKGTKANSWAYLRRFALVAFLGWISIHFLTGGAFV
jgi:hypothetical protein